VETIVSEVWREVLGRSSIARTDNFFSLGGNSLSASQVVVRVREAFEVDFPLRSFLLEPTVAAMAETITASLIGEVSVAPRKDVP
jgi:acyl carrier protein